MTRIVDTRKAENLKALLQKHKMEKKEKMEKIAAAPIPAPGALGFSDRERKEERAEETLHERIARLRKQVAKAPKETPTVASTMLETMPDSIAMKKALSDTTGESPEAESAIGMHGETIKYNKEQQEFIDAVANGESVVLIGAAGTGKTTATRGALTALIQSGKIPVLSADGHKHLKDGTPGIVISSYTRRAVNNIRKVQPLDLKNNCITIHKLLEYQPVKYEVYDEEAGVYKTTMRFEPSRNESNPLPTSIAVQVVEEASMESTDLYHRWNEAMGHEVQQIFIGDIQQLPPVFGPAILGFKMNELRVIELKQVYRQALESPIIRLAHRILSGVPIPEKQFEEWNQNDEHGQLKLVPWKKKISDNHAMLTMEVFFRKDYEAGNYDPEEDIILMPFNKSFGTIEMNKHIANFIARKKEAVTYEVQAGFEKHYLSPGDKVLYDKEDAEILEIKPNPRYLGKRTKKPSKFLDYWGHYSEDPTSDMNGINNLDDMDDIDMLLEAASASSEDKVNQASHNILIRLKDSMRDVELNTAAELNALLLGYAITVHKSQGSEWRKVYFVSHQSNNVMINRELLYTAVTRAREKLFVICEPDALAKGITKQRIKGNTLEEKAEQFKGKIPANWGDEILEKGGRKKI